MHLNGNKYFHKLKKKKLQTIKENAKKQAERIEIMQKILIKN